MSGSRHFFVVLNVYPYVKTCKKTATFFDFHVSNLLFSCEKLHLKCLTWKKSCKNINDAQNSDCHIMKMSFIYLWKKQIQSQLFY